MITVLIVADEAAARKAIRDLIVSIVMDLRHAPVRILRADSAEEALGVISGEPVDLLITDYDLPGLTGLELIQQISDRLEIMKVLLTDKPPSLQVRILAAEAGLEAIIQKPVRREDLRRILTRLL